MPRFSPNSLTLSLLPVLVIPVALSVGLPRQSAVKDDMGVSVLYQAPSPATDPIHVCELTLLRHEINDCEHTAAHLSIPSSLHPNLSAEYRLIVRETTPEALHRTGLPPDMR